MYIGLAFCVVALGLIFWAVCRYFYEVGDNKPLEKHRNKFKE